MAIPIRLPISEDAEDSYRSLDLLLEQLLITLRQVLIHRRREAAANAPIQIVRHRHVASEGTALETTTESMERAEESTTVSDGEETSSLPLPDVVLDATQGVSQEQKESDRTREEERPETNAWVKVGNDLKRIADQLLATNRLDQKDEKRGKMKEDKDASLLSLLCPPLGGSVWTTVVLLVGWGLLSRTR